MLKKVFLLDLFGITYDWINKYIENCNTLAKYGWDWIIFTDQEIKGKGNVKVVPMDIMAVEYEIKNKLGIEVDLNDKRAVDGRAVGEFHPAFGALFNQYIEGYDFWGYTNIDVIYGRLDRFVSDEFLSGLDIFGNDPEQMNGIFSLLRNNWVVNNLFTEVPKWKDLLSSRIYTAFDEIVFSKIVIEARNTGKLRVEFRDWRDGDRRQAEEGRPVAKLKILEDGTLMDIGTNKEIMMFHFGGIKRWCV